MEINQIKLLKLRDEIIDFLIANAVDQFAIKKQDYWKKKYEDVEFTDLVDEYYTAGFNRGYNAAINLYQKTIP